MVMLVSEAYNHPNSPGTLRPSQLITSFGPGSIVQTENDSVLIMGLQVWGKDLEGVKHKKLYHPILQGITKKKEFRMPISIGRSQVVPCVSFPRWGVCSNIYCKRLQKHDPMPKARESRFFCQDCGHPLIHARFITMCDKGHIDEFPWERWAHKDSEFKNTLSGTCNKPTLRFITLGKNPGLSNYAVLCKNCNSRSNAGPALSPRGLLEMNPAIKCSGYCPWLGDIYVDCDEIPRGVQTRATNVYFSSVISAIFVKKWVNPAQTIIKERIGTIRDLLESNLSPDSIASTLKFFKELTEQNPEWTPQKIAHEIVLWEEAKNVDYKKSSELEIKNDEFADLEKTNNFSHADFEISSEKVSNELFPYVEKLKKLSRITEIRTIRGFTRGQAPDPFSSDKTQNQNVNFCHLSPKSQDWLPAVENRGEGIFFTLNELNLHEWEENPKVISRFKAMRDSFKEWAIERKWNPEEEFRPRYVLLHTLAHLLIRELAVSAGYDAPSIRERIYRSDMTNGVIIYTASSSSEGSLGGLVKMGTESKFKEVLKSAIHHSLQCSRDPLCFEDDPVEKKRAGVQAISRINGSACYACALLPETSCENSNRLLDRQLVSNESFGFFKDFI